jgi:hypothetical protein
MKDAVLEIKREIEETHGGRDHQPPGEPIIKREAPTAVGQKSKTEGSERKGAEETVEWAERETGGPAQAPTCYEGTSRSRHLPKADDGNEYDEPPVPHRPSGGRNQPATTCDYATRRQQPPRLRPSRAA